MQQREQEQDLLFGSPYTDKVIAGVIAVDFLLLPILLSSIKSDDSLYFSLNAISLSLPTAGWYLLMRAALGAKGCRSRWNTIDNRSPRFSKFLKFFFFVLLPFVASVASLLAPYYVIAQFSRVAGAIFLLTGGAITLLLFPFLLISDWPFPPRHEVKSPSNQKQELDTSP